MGRVSENATFARVYLYNLKGDLFAKIVDKGELIDDKITDPSWELRGKSLKASLDLLTKTFPEKLNPAWCFIPRHAIVYFDDDELIRGYVEICFECNNFMAYPLPYGMVQMNSLKYFRQLFDKLNVPIFGDDQQYLQYRK